MVSTPYPSYHRLFDVIQDRLALTLDDQRRAEVVRAIDELSAAEGVYHIQDLVFRLAELPITQSLWQRVIRIATVGETYFFRDRNQLNALHRSILPGLIAERRQQNRKELRIWSAGCATGEEPYTIAMMLRELIPDFATWNLVIHATDLNIKSLDRAREGMYRPWSFRAETPANVRQQWFVETDGSYQIDNSIRAMVNFAPLNLASDDYPSYTTGTYEMDVILCRNVLIYFDNPTIAAVIKRFENALRPQGWLVLGHAESAHITNGNYAPRNYEHAVLYQKCLPLNTLVTRPLEPIDEVIIPEAILPPSKLLSRLSVDPQPVTQKPRDVQEPAAEEDPWERALEAANKEDWSEALAWLTTAEKKRKLRPEVHYLRGVVELHQGQVKGALASLRQAIYCNQEFVLAHFVLGEIFEQQGQFRKAFGQWKQAYTLLERLPAEQPIAYSDDLTVEMLRAVLEFRLDNLPKGMGGTGHLNATI